MTIHAALTDAATRLGHNPAVVFRDAQTGERTELSWATLHNWVSKTANLLLDQFDAGLGSQVEVDLPLHWMAPVVCLGAWAAGACVTVDGGGDVKIAHEVDTPPGDPDILIGAGMGGRLTATADDDAVTVIDILAEPDDFIDDPGDEGAWAIGGRTQATLLLDSILGESGVTILHPGDRVTEETIFLIARTLPAGTALVLARGYDEAGLRKVASEERTTTEA